MNYQERMENVKYLESQLPRNFRQFPMYQFFMETGPLECWILHQKDSMQNSESSIGVFILESEANMAIEFMAQRAVSNNLPLSYRLEKSKITWFQFKKGK